MASQNQTHQSQSRRSTREREHNGETELHQASELFRDTIEEIRERSDDVKATVQEYVHQKPFKALAIAVASGMALALLLKR